MLILQITKKQLTLQTRRRNAMYNTKNNNNSNSNSHYNDNNGTLNLVNHGIHLRDLLDYC